MNRKIKTRKVLQTLCRYGTLIETQKASARRRVKFILVIFLYSIDLRKNNNYLSDEKYLSRVAMCSKRVETFFGYLEELDFFAFFLSETFSLGEWYGLDE